MESELVKLLSWDHPLFKNDNKNNVFDRMERALIGTPYASTIFRFRKARDVNKAMAAIFPQHAGKDVWEKLIKHSKDYMVQESWTGQTRQALVAHIDRHRQAYVVLIEAADHVSHQIPSERTCVSYLMNTIDRKDAEVLAGLSAIRQDDAGMRGDFESAAIFLSPTCPVANKGTDCKVGFDAATISAADAKTGIGKTGVELRYHTKKAFWALPEEQQREVADHNAINEGVKFKGMGLKHFKTNKKQGTSGDSQGTSEKNLKSWVLSSVAKAMKSQGTEKTDAKEKLAKSLVSLISSITGYKISTDGVTDAIMEQATIAAGQLQAISKEGSCRGRSNKKP